MSKSAQLKRKGAEYEQKRQYDKALTAYAQAIEAAAGIPDELDIPLYNRVGDLHLRVGDLDKAVSFYESAVDLYAEGGFFNNAIALCNKVLRHAPSRTVIYYKLGKISAKKGFNSDAKQNFLEYASRTEKAGDMSEAFRALKEFADLCPGQDDVRLMLAEQLARAGRNGEAIEQLQTVYDAMVAEDRGAEANAALERIRALDPEFEPRAAASRQQRKREGLVFIDVDYPAPPADTTTVSDEPLVEPHAGQPLSAAEFGEVQLPAPADAHATRMLDDSPLSGLTPLADPAAPLPSAHPPLETFESMSFAASLDTTSDMPALDIEHTAFDTVSPLSLPHEASHEKSNELPRETAHEMLHENLRVDDSSESQTPSETSAWPDVLDPAAFAQEPTDIHADEPPLGGVSMLAGYVESLSSDVGAIDGGLPSDLAILPPEAIDEEQRPSQRTDDDFVDLTEWLRESEPARNPRMTAEEEAARDGEVQTDFSEMLKTFKAGVAANVDESDADSHYDLGVAYMEMGLFDEAIPQFQKAMRADALPERRLRAYESLGQSFIEKGSFETAIQSLRGALAEPGLGDAKLVGVLYLLGYASESLGRWRDAEGYYRRVFAMDIDFRDIAERLRRAEQTA